MTGRRLLVIAARVLLGLVFVYAAVYKIKYPPGFAKEIFAYGIVPDSLVNLMAIYLPWLELLAGLALVVGVAPRAAGAITACLLVVFLLAIGTRFARGETDFECGCFPHTESFIDHVPLLNKVWAFAFSSTSARETFARDVVLLGLALVVVRASAPARAVSAAPSSA